MLHCQALLSKGRGGTEGGKDWEDSKGWYDFGSGGRGGIASYVREAREKNKKENGKRE